MGTQRCTVFLLTSSASFSFPLSCWLTGCFLCVPVWLVAFARSAQRRFRIVHRLLSFVLRNSVYDKASDVDTLDRRRGDRKTWRHKLAQLPRSLDVEPAKADPRDEKSPRDDVKDGPRQEEGGPRRESPKQAKHDTCCVLTLK